MQEKVNNCLASSDSSLNNYQDHTQDYSGLDFHAALIGGVAFPSDGLSKEISVNTPYGDVTVYLSTIGNRNVALLPRHSGSDGHLPPHMINYRANIYAIHSLGISRIISTNSVGTMKNHPIGSFFLPEDFLDLTRTRPSTFFNDRTVHADVSEPYCPEIRELMADYLENNNIGYSEGVYVCTEGPRFETRAEIRMMRQFGDVVGMTGLPELVLAKELNMCYASICTVTNNACGLGNGKMTVSDVLDTLDSIKESLQDILASVICSLPKNSSCNCRYACSDAEL
ncbi:MTAP family purine nucleoside phosphorylase [Methanolobus bombayensis]|uniref:MTAP family purine nucleoside phosphorylase n=1 Tax=Methanolobus bombayensis TaxID=38023 RepID=UPI001AE4B1A9|nr:MTAP family purine nucleoside phosphorylase [Methanolobus bombayensis]MBP1910024.1 5'-methylthioadenosine phosphorylase [Methanolobus bombayensis]